MKQMLNLTNLAGESSRGTAADFLRLLAELDSATDEQPDVSAANESGVCLSVFRGFRVVLEDIEEEAVSPRHLEKVDMAEISRLAHLLESGRTGDLLYAADWAPGY